MHRCIANTKVKRCRVLLSPVIVILMFAITGCQLAQSGFAKTAGNAGAEFAAAANTLSYVHQGKLTATYAASSFAGYRSQLSGIDQQLPSQQGVPDSRTLHNLLNVYKPAMQAVDAPCLSNTCNWQKQEIALRQASQDFLKAAGQ